MFKYAVILLVISSLTVHAKDFGIRGHVFEIVEENILNVIAKRLKGIDMDKFCLLYTSDAADD